MHRVTGDGQNEFNPVFSRDGSHLYFGVVFEGGKSGDIYSAGIDGKDLKRLTSDLPHAAAPEISPDGKWMVFNSSTVDHKPQIYVMRTDGTERKALTNDNTVAFYNPVWSPNGKRIVYYLERGDNKDQIWSMKPDGTDQRLLTNNIGHNFYPSWSADGKRILFTSNRDGKQALYSMNADGSDVKPMGIESSFARQSPDGKRLVYIAGRFPNMTLFIANADGSNAVKLVP
jgi:TolB protein